MNEIKQALINRARIQFKRIYPCSTKKRLKECFTVEEDKMIFWFNTEDQTTHIMVEDMA